MKEVVHLAIDAETLAALRLLGDPATVLAILAEAATARARAGSEAHRRQTNTSLSAERANADGALELEREAIAGLARDAACLVAAPTFQPASNAAAAASAPDRAGESANVHAVAHAGAADLTVERSRLEDAVAARLAALANCITRLTAERAVTDANLFDERSESDALLVDQREANTHMVGATLRADDAKEQAEARERELRVVADFREMFIAILGHDLRTPMTSIDMAAALMIRRGHLDEQDGAMATRILHSSQRMSRMITQLLDLTRARLGGGLPIDRRPSDLAELCRNVVAEFDAKTTLEVEGDVNGTWDPDRLVELMSNLVGNAIQSATPGTAVCLSAHADGDHVVIRVINQGEPIPTEVLPFIFEPFRRGAKRERRGGGNLGLGLYIAHQIVKAHGGAVSASSAGGATTFSVRLPRVPPAFVERRRFPREGPAAAAHPTGAHLRVVDGDRRSP